MRRKLTILLLTLLVFIVSMSLIACKGDEELLATNGQVPVYQGMTISGNNTINNLSPRMAPDENASDVAKYIHGDHTGRDEDIDQETPFEEVPTIDQKTESTLSVVGSGAEIYYANKNQDIYITIKVLNPDSYEIVSFTLNGNKYTSYMFEEGSDLENLVLKLNVGEAAGIVDYTIDAIKYIDGTDIKDVIIEGEKTIKAGISADDQTYVNVSNNVTTLNSISFNANLVDLYNLIEKSEGYAKAVLYDGVSIISTKELVSGENSITFDSLVPNKLYQYGIVVLYDNLSGDGIQLNTIYTNAEYTKTIVLFDDISVTQTGINFSYLWEETYENKTISSLSLFLEGEKVEDPSPTALQFSNLLSNVEYEIRASYLNLNQESETISVFFTTVPKATPELSIINPDSTQTSVSFEITVTDVDQVGAVSAIELYKGETLIEALTDLSVREFTGLLSNNEYTINVTYTYDLNDGVDFNSINIEFRVKTLIHLLLTNTRVLNTSAISEGQTIVLQATIENPDNATPLSVTINGTSYQVSTASTNTQIRVEILNDGQFEGGQTSLTINKIEVFFDGKNLKFEPKTNNESYVFINGKFEVASLSYCKFNGSSFTEAPYFLPEDEIYYYIILNNKTGYDVNSITIDGIIYDSSDIISIDSSHKVVKAPYFLTLKTAYITSVSYSNVYLSNTVSSSKMAFAYRLSSNVIVEIETKEDLLNMNQGYLYLLKNDIDLYGIEWSGSDFFGVFDGNGYSITNMTIVNTFTDNNYSAGLFKNANGIIQNLTVKDTTVIITIETTGPNAYKTTFGTFAATSSNLAIYKCNSIGNSVKFTNNSDQYPLLNGIGGFVGESSGLIVKESYVTGSFDNSKASVAGIAGLAMGYLFVSDTISNVIVNGGYGASSSSFGFATGTSMQFTHFINASSSTQFGGWLFSSGVIVVDDCLNIGHGFDSLDGTLKVNNSYSINDLTSYGFSQIDVNELLKEFFVVQLKFDENIWSFDGLDIFIKVFPELNQ